ncbi:hypothetical protein FHX49_001520 [Microbacterium endophyticum]|uniref:Uncharacterized protein n=1 Tax=Microbacterium endophyticum TaxID=1526412 RepID=A0A7W4YM89_9MICO|nr:hypothetical protein [Microbacterium endophyticum]MBB2975953.1 hypothetical protein [Microbacterium endophyticum]NIK37678.1 hypothetical protein [Microbacterium endophyticum]
MSDNDTPAVDPATVQDEPVMDMHTATDDERIDGIVDQTRADVGDKSLERIEGVLRQRFEQSGMEFTDELLAELAQRVKI